MKKIISLFKRDYEGTRLVYDEVVPGAEWVLHGEGVATVKIDGTACMLRAGHLYKRYDRKKGKAAPEGWEACEEAADPNTGHWPGWLPVGEGPEDKWHQEGWEYSQTDAKVQGLNGLPDETYELVGPKINGNPYNLARHELWRHGASTFEPDGEPPRTFEGLKGWFAGQTIAGVEGIVWWHPDGRMVKIKRRDFGLKWPMMSSH